MDFSDSIGLLLFLFFLFLQFISSLLNRKTKGKRLPGEGLPDGETPAADIPEGDGAPARPTTFEDALRQIQEALREASAPPKPTPEPTPVEEYDEENAPAFQHFDDFEQHGETHFTSGAHERFEAEENRSPFADYEGIGPATVSGSRSGGPSSFRRLPSLTVSTPDRATDARDRLRRKLRSPEAVQDAYRFHVVLGKPRAKRPRNLRG